MSIATVIISAGRGSPVKRSSASAAMFHGMAIECLKSACLKNNEDEYKMSCYSPCNLEAVKKDTRARQKRAGLYNLGKCQQQFSRYERS